MKILPAIVVVFMLLMVVVSNGVIAQTPTPEPTVLGPGDIAIIGYNTTDGNDEIAFLFLQNTSIYSIIQFSDIGWDNTKTIPGFSKKDYDGIFSWRAEKNYSLGSTEKTSHVLGSSEFNIKNNTNGDQIFILQGNYVTNPNLIFGLNVNHTAWQNLIAPNEYTSGLPQQLINNNFIYEFLNAKYIGKTNFSDANSARLEIMNPVNWQGSDTVIQDLTFTGFSIGTTAVDIDNFSAIKNRSRTYLYFFLIFVEIIIFIIRFYKITQIKKEK